MTGPLFLIATAWVVNCVVIDQEKPGVVIKEESGLEATT
jgi:hypothetical protein